MNINAALVKQLRSERSWSQEELAIASGLHLRTVQRIEKEATASLQSRKALASTFDVSIKDLEYQEITTMRKHEYKTVDIDVKKGFLSGFKSKQMPDLEGLLNKEGQNGWRLIQILNPDQLNSFGKATERMVAIFERELSA
jgi:transcriptional regulator with XRE-family HTH domain